MILQWKWPTNKRFLFWIHSEWFFVFCRLMKVSEMWGPNRESGGHASSFVCRRTSPKKNWITSLIAQKTKSLIKKMYFNFFTDLILMFTCRFLHAFDVFTWRVFRAARVISVVRRPWTQRQNAGACTARGSKVSFAALVYATVTEKTFARRFWIPWVSLQNISSEDVHFFLLLADFCGSFVVFSTDVGVSHLSWCV